MSRSASQADATANRLSEIRHSSISHLQPVWRMDDPRVASDPANATAGTGARNSSIRRGRWVGDWGTLLFAWPAKGPQ